MIVATLMTVKTLSTNLDLSGYSLRLMNSGARPLSFAMLALSVRPNISFPSVPWTHAWASSRERYKTKATPRLFLVSRSRRMVTLWYMKDRSNFRKLKMNKQSKYNKN